MKCGHCHESHETIAEVRACWRPGDGSSIGTEIHQQMEQAAADFFSVDSDHAVRADAPSGKQAKFLRDLLENREIPNGSRLWAIKIDNDLGQDKLTKRDAHKAINRLLGYPKKSREQLQAEKTQDVQDRDPALDKVRPTQKVVLDGMYRSPNTGEIFKVQKAIHGSGQLYAKQLVMEAFDESTGERQEIRIFKDDNGIVVEGVEYHGRFNYSPGAIQRLQADWLMTREEAKKFGALYGTCIRCGTMLTREDSIERMMGPVCAKKAVFA